MLNTDTVPINGALGLVNTVDVVDGSDIPPALVAVTINVYEVFAVNPDTIIGEVVFVPINPPGLLVTVYSVIVPFPPLGAVKETLTEDALNILTKTFVGTFVFVVTALDAVDKFDIPPEFVAVTLNVYAVFAINPNTIIGEVIPIDVITPGLLVTVYPVIVPVPLGAVKAILTELESITVAVPMMGATVFVVTILDAVDKFDIPPEFVAVTLNVYAVFDVNPDTIIGEVRFVPVDVISPGLLIMTYPVIVPVPLDVVNSTLTEFESITVAVPMVGAFGFVVFDTDGPDAGDIPDALVAVTVNVYEVFGVNPDTVIGEVRFVPVDVIPSGLLVTV